MGKILFIFVIVIYISHSQEKNKSDSISNDYQIQVEEYFSRNQYDYPWENEDNSLNNDSLFALYYIRVARVYLNINDDSATKYFQNAYELIEKYNFNHLKIKYYLNKGIFKGYKEDNFEAIVSLETAEQISLENNDSAYLPLIYTNLSLLWSYLGDNKKYLSYFNKSIKINEKSNKHTNNVMLWVQYCENEIKSGDTSDAKKNAINILKSGEKVDNYIWTPYAKNKYAKILLDLSLHEQARPILKELNLIADTIYYQPLAFEIYMNNLKLNLWDKNLEESNYYINRLRSMTHNTNIVEKVNLAMLHSDLLLLENKLDSAEKVLIEIDSESIKSLKNNLNIQILNRLIHINELSGNNNKVDSLNERLAYFNEISSFQEQEQEYKTQEFKLKIQQKEIELENLSYEQKIKNQRYQLNLTIISSTLILLFIIIVFIIYRNKNRIKQKEQEKLKIENEKETLTVRLLEKENNLRQQTKEISELIEQKNQLENEILSFEEKSKLPNLDELIGKIKEKKNSKEYWNQFEVKFLEIYPEFFNKLNSSYPDLTRTELKVLAFIKINFNSKEIANVFGIESSTIDWHRKNIRKKLDIPKSEEILQFLLNNDL